MAVAALILEVAYFGLAIVGRTWLQWRRTGDTGYRIGRGASLAAKVASIAMVAGTAIDFLVPVLAMSGMHVSGAPVSLRLAGLVLLAVGIAGTVSAQLTMGASWRVGVGEHEHTELVSHGVFARVRNPIFSCMVVAAIGMVLAMPHWLALAAVVLVVFGVEVQVRAVEEPYLLRNHGDAYRDYLARAGRFWPVIGRRPSITPRS